MLEGYRSEINNTYERIRSQEKQNLQNRYNEIKKLHPNIIEIDRQISLLSVKVSMVAMKKSDNKEAQIMAIKDEVEDLRRQKYELLVANGYNMDYLTLHYHCKKCKDTGFIGVTKCSCYQNRLVEILYKKSDISKLLLENNFSKFKFDFFRDIKHDGERVSPKANMLQIYNNITKSYLPSFDSHNMNLLFLGNSGTGKSFMSHCIAKELIDKGFLVVYRTADELIKSLREIRFNNNKDLESLLLNCDLLIIDDLGTEFISDFSKSELFTFLNSKLLKEKKMIISTNLSMEELKTTYTERLNSRLFGNFKSLVFLGDDIRLEKVKRKRTQT